MRFFGQLILFLTLWLQPVAELWAAKPAPAQADSKATEATKLQTAVFAGGCFWCMEPPYDDLRHKGIVNTEVGYAGGSKEDATYGRVSSGETEHLEVIRVTYNPEKISYAQLLKVFWKNIDPYDAEGQFCDKGKQYLSAAFYASEEEKAAFEKSKKELIESGQLKDEIATQLLPDTPFYSAEEYHQNYYTKNPIRYKIYRYNCGRDSRLEEVWGSEKGPGS